MNARLGSILIASARATVIASTCALALAAFPEAAAGDASAPAAFGRGAVTHGAGARPNSTAPFAFEAFGGYQGQLFVPHTSGDQFEYSESVAVEFTQALDSKHFVYKISPAAPSSVYFGNDYVRTATITVRKVPGFVYTLNIPASTLDKAGAKLGQELTFTFTTAKVPPVVPPTYHTAGQPYRYGVLEHPFPPSLGGTNAAQQIDSIAKAGARFARIDYCGAQSELVANKFDFKTEDAIMDKLAAKGLTELPIIEQYCSPPWANGGSDATTPVWTTPALYAQFAAGVAAHVALKYPQITRLELFNEPNLAGWWNAPAPYDNQTGISAAQYMAAAYAAVKAVAPKMTVVGPALSDGGDGTEPRTFLQNMYATGCRTGVCWDVLSVHNYAWMNPVFASEPYLPASYYNRWDVYKDLQAIALAAGEKSAPHVMLTEWGISIDPTSPQAFDPRVQAEYISIAFELMDADPTVDGLVYTNIYNPGTDFFALMSLETASFKPLPAFSTYHAFSTY